MRDITIAVIFATVCLVLFGPSSSAPQVTKKSDSVSQTQSRVAEGDLKVTATK
jgi:hypothetical protein